MEKKHEKTSLSEREHGVPAPNLPKRLPGNPRSRCRLNPQFRPPFGNPQLRIVQWQNFGDGFALLCRCCDIKKPPQDCCWSNSILVDKNLFGNWTNWTHPFFDRFPGCAGFIQELRWWWEFPRTSRPVAAPGAVLVPGPGESQGFNGVI